MLKSRVALLLLIISSSVFAAVWEPAPSFPDAGMARAYGAGLHLADSLYVFGGRPFDGGNDAMVHRLNPGAGSWTQIFSLEGAVVHVAAGIDNLDRIVIFGGVDVFNGDTGNVYTYNLEEGPQEGLADRVGAAPDSLFAWVTDDQNYIYSMGGGLGANAHSGQPNSSEAQRYNGASDTWTLLSPMPIGVADAAACLDNQGNILVIGGYDALGNNRTTYVQSYNIATGSWSLATYPELPVALTGHCAVLGADNRVYVMGGVAGSVGSGTTQSTVYVLNPLTGTWNTGPSMAEARRHFAAALRADDSIYAMGGMNESGGVWTSEKLFTPTCPEFTQQPESAEPWDGQIFELNATVIGGVPLSYQWRRDGIDLIDGSAPGGGVISGALSSELTITDIGLADSGVYDLVATNDCGQTFSDAAQIDVRTPPNLLVDWTTELLHPLGAQSSKALDISGNIVSGFTTVPAGAEVEEHAWKWNTETGMEEDLHPLWDPVSPKSWARASYGDTSVGFWWHPYEIFENGNWYVIYEPKACRWVGGPAGFEEIILGGSYEHTYLGDIDASGSVGYAAWDDEVGNTYANAFWIDSAGLFRWLHPDSGASKSVTLAIDNGRQYGYINTPYPGPATHASYWTGTANSVVDINPVDASRSWISKAEDGQQIGEADYAGGLEPTLWHGSEEGCVRLTPTGSLGAYVYGVGSGLQLGALNVGGMLHACAWTGTADSAVDLHSWLPAAYTSSTAQDAELAVDGTLRIVGQAYNEDLARQEAVMWISGPTGTGVADWNPHALGLRSWPNPTVAGGKVTFTLSRDSEVSLDLFTLDGRRVQQLKSAPMQAGIHSLAWNRRDASGARLSSGIYLMRLKAGRQVETGKVVLLD